VTSAQPETGPVRRGLLIILSSPSGAGKSTLSRRMLEADPEVRFSVSATTRPPRPGEQEGRDYFFKSRREFEALAEAGEMLEYAEVFGNLYGTPLTPVKRAIRAGADVLFDVDWQGGQQIRNSSLADSVVSIFILPPSIVELESRLNQRGQDTAEVVQARMSKSRDEISHWAEYDYVLVNESLTQCEGELRAIVQAERLRRDRRPDLMSLVNRMNREFEERLK
jgi:guanylate kinase